MLSVLLGIIGGGGVEAAVMGSVQYDFFVFERDR